VAAEKKRAADAASRVADATQDAKGVPSRDVDTVRRDEVKLSELQRQLEAVNREMKSCKSQLKAQPDDAAIAKGVLAAQAEAQAADAARLEAEEQMTKTMEELESLRKSLGWHGPGRPEKPVEVQAEQQHDEDGAEGISAEEPAQASRSRQEPSKSKNKSQPKAATGGAAARTQTATGVEPAESGTSRQGGNAVQRRKEVKQLPNASKAKGGKVAASRPFGILKQSIGKAQLASWAFGAVLLVQACLLASWYIQ